MKTADVAIIGGGIAGLSAAWCLTRARVRGVALFEREPLFASHSSGRNAAIFRLLDRSAGVPALALRSRELLDELMGGRGAWLRETGAVLSSRSPAALAPLVDVARAHGIAHAIVERPELGRLCAPLASGSATAAIHVPGDGVLDIHAMISALCEAACQGGAHLRTGAAVEAIELRGGRAVGVRLIGGESIGAGAILIASGAWASAIGAAAGAPLALAPMRRHLAQLAPRVRVAPESPVVWCEDEAVYYRPESGGVLASPCDEDEYPPCLPPEEPGALALLAEKLARVAPGLADASVQRSWACLRTFAPDRALVAGPDPRVPGLFWLGGLGGHGMTAGVGAGELAAMLLRGEGHPLAQTLAPSRVLARPIASGDSATPLSTTPLNQTPARIELGPGKET